MQLAQSMHAGFAFMNENLEEARSWMNNSNYIAVLGAKNENELHGLILRAEGLKIKFSAFRESDLNNEITAIALEAGNDTKELCKNLRLALKNI